MNGELNVGYVGGVCALPGAEESSCGLPCRDGDNDHRDDGEKDVVGKGDEEGETAEEAKQPLQARRLSSDCAGSLCGGGKAGGVDGDVPTLPGGFHHTILERW